MGMVIAIDGPAASGKGTLAKRVAAHYGYAHLDTGLLYRAVGKLFLDTGHSLTKAEDHTTAEAIEAAAIAKKLTLEDLKGEDLSCEEVGKAASVVSAIPSVRAALLAFQHNVAADKEGAVLDGRDIGTVICPDADVKLFITASIETRARRRFKQLQNRNNTIIYDTVLMDLQRRDKRDMERDTAPLRPAHDAISIDTTNLTLDEVFAETIAIIENKRNKKIT